MRSPLESADHIHRETVNGEHRDILAAIVDGDPGKTVQLLANHRDNAIIGLQEVLDPRVAGL